MPKNRGPQEKVYVQLQYFKYGWHCNSAKFKAIGAAFGMKAAEDEAGVTYGANSPKPPIARKRDTTGSSVSSFCDPKKTATLKAVGYEVSAGGRVRGIRLVGKSITVYVPTPLGYKYAWNMLAADVPNFTKIGVVAATGTEKDLVWGSFPKPPRAVKRETDGSSYSTFIPPDADAIKTAVAEGFNVEGIDPDWAVAVAPTPLIMENLILPGDPFFDITLATPSPTWKIQQQISNEPLNFVVDADSGVLRIANPDELDEYLYGGEYDEVMREEEEEEDFYQNSGV